MELEDVFSDAGLINCGAPQESILRQLLSLTFVNDLPRTSNKAGSNLYANNTWKK